MIHGINMPGKGNPSWTISNALETKTVPDAFRAGCGVIVAWLIGLPRRAGRRLFAMNDAEARWHRWQVTELRGGLARSYHDPRFGLLSAAPTHNTPEPDTPDTPDAPDAADPPTTVHRCPGDWDDVHGWPWDGEG